MNARSNDADKRERSKYDQLDRDVSKEKLAHHEHVTQLDAYLRTKCKQWFTDVCCICHA